MQQSQENNRRLLRKALPNLAPGYGDAAHDKAAERLARDMEKPVGALLACITDDRQRAMYQAAPDLYAACDMVLEAATEEGHELSDSEICSAIDWEMLRAAIARAKGGEA